MKILRAGIIGCGNIARKHAAAALAISDIDLVGFYDHNLENAETLARELGRGQAYDALPVMLDALELHLAFICLPPFAHADEIAQVCARGIHFVMEKPIALSPDKARWMVEQVEAARVKTQVAFVFRNGAAVQWLKKYLIEHPAPAYMTARYSCNSLHRAWWRDRTKSGGQVVEQAIHLLDLTRYFLGEPVSVFSMQENLFHRGVGDYSIEDASGTLIRFANGSIAVVTATNGAIPGRWDSDWRVVAQELTADFGDANHAVMHHTAQLPVTRDTIEADENLFYAQTLDLVNAIGNDCPTRAPIQEGYRSLELALAAAQSAKQQLPVNLPL